MTTVARTAAAVAAAALVGALTACGGNDNPPPAPQTSSAQPAGPTSASGPGPATTTRKTTTAPQTPQTTKTAQTPAPGTTIAGEGMSAADAAALQQSVDQGHQPWRLDVAAVAEAFVRSRLGWSGADVALADPHTAEVTNTADGRIVSLQLRQPARAGDGGIWVVDSGVWIS
ncbi:hypothetical protein [Amycolatopsis thermoflava]|uniref:hypothetical protein n=1 Tax=Amycolatopsis thermoflava TaxID=84480 RepID=UPI003654A3B5